MFMKEKLNKIKLGEQEWLERNASEFQKELKEEFITESGIPVKRVYTPLDLAERGFDYEADLGFPGEYPCTRGDSPTMYRSGLWPMAQISGHGSVEESNKIYRNLIASGLKQIVIAPDMPNQFGYDPDHPKATGEVGRVGPSIASLKDLEILLDGIDLRNILVSYAGNALAAVNIAEHLALAQQQGVDWKDVWGYLQNDILKEFAARGNYIFPPNQSMRLVVDALVFCAQHAPKYSALVVTSSHMGAKGASPVHEIAFMLSDLIAYMQACVDRGLDIDMIAPKLGLHAGFHHYDFFSEIAKLRATRRLWAKIMRDRFKAKNPKSMSCRMLTVQSGHSLYKEQPLNNIARAAIATLGMAMIGGRRNEAKPYDEALGIATEESLQTALRIQQIVGYETGICDTADPLAGSYFLESLTSEFERRISKEIEVVENMGGAVKAIEQGYFQLTIAKDAFQSERALLDGKIIRVGVNRFRSDKEDKQITVYRTGSELEKKRIAEITRLRKGRNNQKVTQALDEVKAVACKKASNENNMLPPLIEATKAYATRGEIADALRDVWGEYSEPTIF